jgi:hypothetical protein
MGEIWGQLLLILCIKSVRIRLTADIEELALKKSEKFMRFDE